MIVERYLLGIFFYYEILEGYLYWEFSRTMRFSIFLYFNLSFNPGMWSINLFFGSSSSHCYLLIMCRNGYRKRSCKMALFRSWVWNTQSANQSSQVCLFNTRLNSVSFSGSWISARKVTLLFYLSSALNVSHFWLFISLWFPCSIEIRSEFCFWNLCMFCSSG